MYCTSKSRSWRFLTSPLSFFLKMLGRFSQDIFGPLNRRRKQNVKTTFMYHTKSDGTIMLLFVIHFRVVLPFRARTSTVHSRQFFSPGFLKEICSPFFVTYFTSPRIPVFLRLEQKACGLFRSSCCRRRWLG